MENENNIYNTKEIQTLRKTSTLPTNDVETIAEITKIDIKEIENIREK